MGDLGKGKEGLRGRMGRGGIRVVKGGGREGLRYNG